MYRKIKRFFGVDKTSTYDEHPESWMASFAAFEFNTVALRTRHYTRTASGPYNTTTLDEEANTLGSLLDAKSINQKKNMYAEMRRFKYHESGVTNKVLVGTEDMYLPMIDFVGKPTKFEMEVWCQRMARDLPFLRYDTLVMFNSGNSYHGYIFKLISPQQNEQFIDFLEHADYVDKAWIECGKFNLRWTTSTQHTNRIEPRYAFSVLA